MSVHAPSVCMREPNNRFRTMHAATLANVAASDRLESASVHRIIQSEICRYTHGDSQSAGHVPMCCSYCILCILWSRPGRLEPHANHRNVHCINTACILHEVTVLYYTVLYYTEQSCLLNTIKLYGYYGLSIVSTRSATIEHSQTVGLVQPVSHHNSTTDQTLISSP